MTTEKPAQAGVHVPPPLIYAGGLVIAWLLGRVWPLPIARSPESTGWTIRLAIAAVLVLAWLALFVSALAAFRRAHTTLIPNRPATAFVTDGPYRWSRNPIYVSFAVLYLAVAFWMNEWWAVLMIVPVLFIIRTAAIAREERYLASAFPADYAVYCARTRRWL